MRGLRPNVVRSALFCSQVGYSTNINKESQTGYRIDTAVSEDLNPHNATNNGCRAEGRMVTLYAI